MKADDLHSEAEAGRRLNTGTYKSAQKKLYEQAQLVLKSPRRDADN
jgi:hypothetical protein